MVPQTTKFRLYTFKTLAAAMASTRTFPYGTFITVKGDTSRFKIGGGIDLSFDTPVTPTSKTFAQLPWYIGEPTSGSSFAAPATATLTAAQLLNRYITTTSAAATTLTLPTATLLATALGATRGYEFNFTIDNSTGASTVTVALGTGITVPATPVITGSSTLTVAAGAFAKFRIIFTSATAALIYRTL